MPLSKEKQCRIIQQGRFKITLGVLCAKFYFCDFAHRNMMKGEVAMHIIHGEHGDVAHSHHHHEHEHGEHCCCGHDHDHDHGHCHEHDHSHEDGCCCGHDHEHHHDHEDGCCCGHDHGHHHDHHGHDHGHSHSHEGCCCHKEQDETVALLTYMLDHNVHHAAELESMAAELRAQGKSAAADMIDKGGIDFQTANMRLRVALSMLSEQA